MKVIPKANDIRIDLHIQLLGGFAVSAIGAAIPEAQWKSRRARNLVKLLALTTSHRLHRDQVIDTLWVNADPSAAANNFHQTLYTARHILEGAGLFVLALEDGFLSLAQAEGQSLTVDLEQFDAAAAQAKSSQDPQAYQDALALYTGDLLPDDLYEEWTIPHREALRIAFLHLLLDLAELHETRQEYPQGIAALQQVLSVERSHEEAHAGLMRLYALSGQRQQALRQYQTLRDVLRQELEAEPSQNTIQLYEKIQSGEFSPSPPRTKPAHNLPVQLSALIGREKEIETLKQIILSGQTRLVTVTGAGGTGKTRLALEVSRRLLDAFPQGVFLVEINLQNTAESLLPVIAQTIGLVVSPPTSLSPQSADGLLQVQLWDYLEDKTMLLVLDNFESILNASVQVYDLLRKTSRLKILITSRARLNLEGETVFPLTGLSFPLLPEDAGETYGYEAIELFVDIARRTHPDFALNANNLPAIAEICRLTQGMPLGILLAAGWCGVLEPEEIALEIQRSQDFLAGGSISLPDRQRSLRATFEYSWSLLGQPQRIDLMRLALFPGGFSAARALQVCGISLPALKILIDQSLLQHSAKSRFRMHDLLHQFTREKLDSDPEEALVLRRQFVKVYLDALADWSERMKSGDQLKTLVEMNVEQDNFSQAWGWAVQQETIELPVRSLDGICRYFYLTCRYQEGWSMCRQSEQHLGEKYSPFLHTGLRRWQGVFLDVQNEVHYALQIIQPLVQELHEKVSTWPGLTGELAAAGLVLADIQNTPTFPATAATLELAQESLRLFRILGNPWDIARALCTITEVHSNLGNRLECYNTALEALEVLSREGDPYLITLSKTSLSGCYILAGDYELALPLVQELVAYYRQVGDRYSQAKGERMLVMAYWYAGQFAEARKAISRCIENLKNQEAFLKKDVRRIENFLELNDAAVDLFTGKYDDAYSKSDLHGRQDANSYPLDQAVMGSVSLVREDLAQAVVHLERSHTIFQQLINQDHAGWALVFLSLVSFRMKEFEKSRSYLIEALENAEKYRVITVICFCLADLALFLAEGGDVEQAVEIYAAVTTYPLAKNAIFFYDLYQKRIDALAAVLPSEIFDQARQRGSEQNPRELLQKYYQRLIEQPDFILAW